jgi:hypothetical protein
MYPIALYGSLPEIGYLAPRGSFLAPRLADDEPPSRRRGDTRSSPAPDAVTTNGQSRKA